MKNEAENENKLNNELPDSDEKETTQQKAPESEGVENKNDAAPTEGKAALRAKILEKLNEAKRRNAGRLKTGNTAKAEAAVEDEATAEAATESEATPDIETEENALTAADAEQIKSTQEALIVTPEAADSKNAAEQISPKESADNAEGDATEAEAGNEAAEAEAVATEVTPDVEAEDKALTVADAEQITTTQDALTVTPEAADSQNAAEQISPKKSADNAEGDATEAEAGNKAAEAEAVVAEVTPDVEAEAATVIDAKDEAIAEIKNGAGKFFISLKAKISEETEKIKLKLAEAKADRAKRSEEKASEKAEAAEKGQQTQALTAENETDKKEIKTEKPAALGAFMPSGYHNAKNIEDPEAFRRALIAEADNVLTGKNKKPAMKVTLGGLSKREAKLAAREAEAAQKEGRPQNKVLAERHTASKVFLCLFSFCFICGTALLTVFITWMLQAPELDRSKFEFTTATVIYDNTGKPYQTLQGSEMRVPVTVDEIPEMVQLAFIAIEDQRFYSHFGVDIRGTLKAIVSVASSGSTSGPGGSTITQQLIKQTHLTSAVSVKRKVMEWYLSVKLEGMLDKREILEAYLNKVNMSDAWGIEAASRYYFGLHTNQLSIAQSAVLAAIINSPAYYNPYDYRENEDGNYYLYKYKDENDKTVIGYSEENLSRASDVVDKMYELGYISTREYEIAMQDLTQNRIALIVPSSVETYTYFTDAVYAQVINDLVATYNYSEEDATDLLLNGGLNVYSTVDTVIQSTLEANAADDSNFPDQSGNAADASYALSVSTGTEVNLYPQVGGAVIENSTGKVVGIIGGRTKTVSLALNRGLEPYQVGSTTKPLTVYSAGIESGAITLATTFDDSRYSFGGGWRPVNHGYASSESMMTVREALRTSVNVVAVLAQMRVGDATSIAYGQKYGLNLKLDGEVNDSNASALALGGYVIGQTPMAMASAYTVFPNGGWRMTPTFYTHVTDSNGVTILTAKQEKIDVISPQTAWIVTDVLKQVVRGGTTYVSLYGQQVGGKTGTTDSNRAVWFCGFTPQYTGVFRYGYDYNSVTVDGYTYDLYINTTSGGSVSPAQFWRSTFSYFYDVKGIAPADLPSRPDGIFVGTVDAESGMLPGELTQNTVSDYFLPGTMPSEVDNMHKKFKVCAVTGKFPNANCATIEKVFFVKDDSVLLPSGARRLTGESQEPKEEDPCTVCTPESIGLNIYGVMFPVSEVTLKEGETTSLTLTDSLGNLLTLGVVASQVNDNSVATCTTEGKNVVITGVKQGSCIMTASLTLNPKTDKEVVYVANVTVTVSPATPPTPPTPPTPEG